MTKKQWEGLTPKAQWDIMAAMRGPDLPHSSRVKWVTTSVIRGQMREAFRVGGLVNTDLPLILYPHDYDLGAGSAFDSGHFLDHVRVAAEAAHIPALSVTGKVFRKYLDRSESAFTAFAPLVTDIKDRCGSEWAKECDALDAHLFYLKKHPWGV